MRRWYENALTGDSPALQSYLERGIERAILWAPDRMVDAAEEMLVMYRQNDNPGPPGKRSLLPIVLLAMAKDYAPTMGDWGGRQVERRLVQLTDEPNASTYGYRQAMGDIRTQVVIIGPESTTARSMAVQFCWYIGNVQNRRFKAPFQWGQYTLEMPVMVETPDIQFMNVATDEQTSASVLVADLALKVTIPYLDAPKIGEPNDGSGRNPPGYPATTVERIVATQSTTWGK